MIKRKSSISINIISALIILVSLFIGIIGQTNAWFTAEHKNGVQIIVNVGDLKLNLYQKLSGATDLTPVYTYDENNKETTTEKKYITLDKKIIPDEQVDLELILKNEDAGSASMYLRFKFELYARGLEEDTLIPTTLVGTNPSFNYVEPVEGDVNSGYYYYQDGDENILFTKDSSVSLMTDFVVEYEDLFNDSGTLLNIASETLYIKLTIDASITNWLETT
ncbi:MAG: hypothetical protein IJ415_00805 [Clostridia bacterium]|nr:hypothetical protein [Clostridia bacterium]